jgi:hypothetical protein
MAYVVEPINVTGTLKEKVIDPRSKKATQSPTAFKWWLAQDEKSLCSQLLSTTEYLKRVNQMRVKQASIFTRLFSGKPLYNFLASTATLDNSNQLPIGRPTANVVYSCIDTLTSRIGSDRPQPTFLTDGGDYKQRRLSKDANQFILGEFHREKVYEKKALEFRDACVLGNGFIKIGQKDNKVCAERVIETEILTDYNDSYYGNPTQLIHIKLVDRSTFLECFPDHENIIEDATHGNVDQTPRSTETVADQFIIAEGWHRRSSEIAEDGRHVIACSSGVILDETWKHDYFPFTKQGYNPNVVGWYAQGLTEILMPTQMELYRILIIASQSIELMGVPRILIEEMSKILETSFNNRIGSIIKYRNIPPQFVTTPSLGPDIMPWVLFLLQNSRDISGVSAMSAAGVTRPGLNSGESIREANEVQENRFSALQQRYQDGFTDLAEKWIDKAKDIVDSTGKAYKTTFAGKDGVREIDFKSIGMLKDTYVIQLYEQSSLPKDPAGRQAKLSEMLASGEITNQEFRRLSNFPDLKQSDQLAAALEERILYSLDKIIDGDKNFDFSEIAPDPFILDPTDLATTLTVNYINKYAVTNLEEEKMDLLRTYFTQIQDLKKSAAPPPQQAMPNNVTQLPVQPPQQSVSPTSNVAV